METAAVQQIQALAAKVQASVARVIVGRDEVVGLTVTALLCEGHVLIEDVPGLGKTVLAWVSPRPGFMNPPPPST